MLSVNPDKKALCVGIAYTGQTGPYKVPPEQFELAGAHEDVEKICDLLTSYYGYEKQNIHILQDSVGYASPTRDNILAAMEELVKSATPRGSLFFFFAGHGDQITNLDGKERDFKDEIILPLDWKLDEDLPPEDRERYSVKIIDDEMNDILVKKLPPNCRLTALFDSCHSGTLLDLPFSRFWGPRSKSPPAESPLFMTTAPRTVSPDENRRQVPPRPRRDTRVLYDDLLEHSAPQVAEIHDPAETASINRAVGRGPLELSYTLALALRRRGRMDPYWRQGTWILRGESLDDATVPLTSGAQAVSWSACSDSQNGYEYTHENRSGGVMVKAFVELLTEEPHRTYREILKGLGERLRRTCEQINSTLPKSQWVMQEPQLGSQHKPDLDRLFEP